MRNFQVRVSDELYDHIKSLADDQEKTVAHVLREALDVRIQSEPYARAGRKLIVLDPKTGESVGLLIPGLTRLPKNNP